MFSLLFRLFWRFKDRTKRNWLLLNSALRRWWRRWKKKKTPLQSKSNACRRILLLKIGFEFNWIIIWSSLIIFTRFVCVTHIEITIQNKWISTNVFSSDENENIFQFENCRWKRKSAENRWFFQSSDNRSTCFALTDNCKLFLIEAFRMPKRSTYKVTNVMLAFLIAATTATSIFLRTCSEFTFIWVVNYRSMRCTIYHASNRKLFDSFALSAHSIIVLSVISPIRVDRRSLHCYNSRAIKIINVPLGISCLLNIY